MLYKCSGGRKRRVVASSIRAAGLVIPYCVHCWLGLQRVASSSAGKYKERARGKWRREEACAK